MNFSFQINVIVHKLFTFFMTLTYIGIPVIFYYARSHNSGFVNWYKWMIPTYIITIVLCIIIKWIRQIISRFIRDRIIHHFNDLSKSWGIQPKFLCTRTLCNLFENYFKFFYENYMTNTDTFFSWVPVRRSVTGILNFVAHF